MSGKFQPMGDLRITADIFLPPLIFTNDFFNEL